MKTPEQEAALKKVRTTLAEYTRVCNAAFYGGHIPNDWYGTDQNPRTGVYKNKEQVVWGDAIDMALKDHKAAIKEFAGLVI